MGEAVVSSGDSSEVLKAPEHALDGVAVGVEIGREAILPATVGLGRDVGCRALALDLATDGIAVIALVAMQDFCWTFGRAVQRRRARRRPGRRSTGRGQ